MAVFNDVVTTTVTIDGNQAVNQLGKLEMEVKDLNSSLKKLKKGTEEYIRANEKIAQAQGEIAKFRKEIGLTGLTMKQLREEQKQLSFELNNTTKGTQAYNDLKKKLQEVNAVIKAQQDDLKGISKAMGDVNPAYKFGDILTNIFKGGAILGIASQVFSVSKEFIKLTDEVNKSKNAVAQMSELTGTSLNQSTAKVRALAESYDKDFNEVLVAANSLAKGMGISFEESLNLVQQGFVKGADVNGEFLDKVKEYPIQFKEAGISAEDFIKIAIQEPKSGIYSDKFIDTIKEAGLRLREMTKASKDALVGAFGSDFSNKLISALDSGKMTTLQALQAINAEAKRVNLTTTQTQTLVADLFAGPGEDAGGFIKVMETLDDALASNLHHLTDIERQTLDNQKANELYNEELVRLSQNFEGVGTMFSTWFTNILTIIFKTTNAVVEFFQTADTKAKNFVKNLAFNTEQEAKMSILKIQAEINAERAKAEKLSKFIEAGGGNQRDKARLIEIQSGIKILESEISNGEKKLLAVRNEAIQKQINLEKEKNKGLSEEQAKASEARIKELQKQQSQLDNFLAEIKEKQRLDEIQQANRKIEIDKMLYTKRLSLIQEFYQKSRREVEEEVAEDADKAFSKFQNSQKAKAENKVTAATKQAGIFGENDQAVVNAKLAQLAVLKEIELQNKELTEQEKLAIENRYRKQSTDLERQAQLERRLTVIEIAQGITQVLSEISQLRFQNESNRAEQEKNDKINQLNQQLAQNLISQEQYATAKADIEAEAENKIADIKTRQAKAEKAFNIANAIMNGTQAVLKALASTAPPLNFVLAGTVGALAAVQIAKIVSTPVPNYYSASSGGGGQALTGGYFDGGFTLKDASDKKAVGVVHANEYVIPARLLQQPTVANMAGVIEAIRTGRRAFMDGGLTSGNLDSADTLASMNAKFYLMIQLLQQLNARPVRAYVVSKDIDDGLDELHRLEDESFFK